MLIRDFLPQGGEGCRSRFPQVGRAATPAGVAMTVARRIGNIAASADRHPSEPRDTPVDRQAGLRRGPRNRTHPVEQLPIVAHRARCAALRSTLLARLAKHRGNRVGGLP